MKYKYIVQDCGMDKSDAETFESDWSEKYLSFIAEDAAEHDFDNCNGHESSWPVKFEIWTEDDKRLGIFEVYLEHDPSFSASKIEE